MSKKFRSQASSSRAAAGGFGAFSSSFGGFSAGFSSQGDGPSSLTYIAEPPDLSRISEPQLAIAFKNLLKKDDITRTKALEDLRDYLSTVENKNGTVDDGFLEAWVCSRRTNENEVIWVRQLSHSIQGSIASLTGKRIVRHLPKVIGAWLAGLYDNDKPVSRSAQDSFTRVFATEEKRASVWKIYQNAILLFVEDVILHQSPLTLSDERTTKPDDAESKYARVLGTAFSLFTRVLSQASEEDLQKDISSIESLLGSKQLWSFSYHDDPFVRKASYQLLRAAIAKEPAALDWKIVSSAVIGKSLNAPQIGSATELSASLLNVTQIRPQIWTDDYSGKSAASKRLHQYIQKGSQGASSSYWSNLTRLLKTIPIEALAKEDPTLAASGKLGLQDVSSLMEAFQDGLNSREEPRQNLATGWKSYIETAIRFLMLLPEEDTAKFSSERILPIVEQFVFATPDGSQWILPSQSAQTLCSESTAVLALRGYESIVESFWASLTDKVLQHVKLSSPEQSKDFKSSQDAVCAQAKRLFTVEASVLNTLSSSGKEPQVREIFETTGVPLLNDCLEVLRSRNGKPYGAAAVIDETVRHTPQIAKRSKELTNFVQEDLPNLLFSPSADRLMRIVLACRDWPGFEKSFDKAVESMVSVEPEESNIHALEKLLSTVDFKGIHDTAELESMVMSSVSKACRGSQLNWRIVIAVVGNVTFHGELTDRILASIIDGLSNGETVSESLHGLSEIASRSPSAMQRFRTGDHGSKLVGKLLYLKESPSDDLSQLAESLDQKLKIMVVEDVSSKSSVEILQHNFSEVSVESLSVDSLVEIAEELIQGANPENRKQTVANILPARHLWERSLEPFLALPPRQSTAITSPLGGIVYLVDRDLSDDFLQKRNDIPRDPNGSSSAFRLVSYVTKILSSVDLAQFLDAEEQETLFYYLPLAVQLIDDDISIEGCNSITGLEASEDREEHVEIVTTGRALINSWARVDGTRVSADTPDLSSTFINFWESKLESLEGNSPEEYRVGEAFAKVMSEVDPSALGKSSNFLTDLSREIRKSNVIRSAAWLSVLRDSVVSLPAGTRLCNELIADSTGIDPQKKRTDALRTLSLLNLLTHGEEDMTASVPTQRLVFLVKNLVQRWQSGIDFLDAKAEILKVLTSILPALKEIYGSHWIETMEILNTVWTETNGGDEGLPLLHASFRLFDRLKSMVNDDANDDLVDAWTESKADLVMNLISTLHKIDSSATFHQPQNATADLLCRLISRTPIDNLESVGEIFSLLNAQSRGIQKAAYEVLHRYIPKTQEQVSFDVALSKSAATLPDELVSLLLEPPTMDSISASYGEERTWISLRSYLLSWKLVFDHFSNASLTVQENYATNIKDNGSLIPLLEFTFDFLQKSHGKLTDASKFDVRFFEPYESETSEKEIQWLLVHLYFLSLKHLPNITKAWWIDSKKRIKGPVEEWTEKFISPLIIEDSLNSVSEWITTQDQDEERALSVKVSPKAAELIASILVDEESPPVAIVITLPSAYPLHPAIVAGKNRVLVDEKKWRSWLLTIQGVIMFSNGNLVDGLLAFRRNVQGALKGQSECAICYSVISTDMQTPNKRCATCKNTFHSVCLFHFSNPPANVRPKFRYWLPDAGVSDDILRADIGNISSVGAGGFEFLPFYLYGLVGEEYGPADWAEFGYGTPAFKKIFTTAAEAAKAHGLVMDFAIGPNQGQGVPAVPESPGLSLELLMGNGTISPGQTFAGPVPSPSQPSQELLNGLGFQHPLEQWGAANLSAVVALKVIAEKPPPGSGGVDGLYSHVQLDPQSAVDLTANVTANGSLSFIPPERNSSWRVFSFWEKYTNQRSCDGVRNPANIVANGSWTVDHFSAAGAKVTTDFFDNHINDDSEVAELISQVGNYAWEDSMEIMATLYWTPGFLERFEKARGYSLLKYLPTLFQPRNIWGSVASSYAEVFVSQNSTSVNLDYRTTLNEGYQDYLKHIQNWSEQIGIQGFSAQPAYNLPLDMLADIPLLTAPELESLGFENTIDLYRQFTGAAHLSNRNIISSEAGAVNVAAYSLRVPEFLGIMTRSYAGGVNQIVAHGFPYSGSYTNTTWPGYTTFFYQYTEMWNQIQPAWRHFRDIFDFMGRTQWALQQGSPLVDLALYMYKVPWETTVSYSSDNLRNVGYSYEYLSCDDFQLPQATVQDSVLAADGPAYKAIVFENQTVISVGGARSLLRVVNSGLPVLFVGNPPNQSNSATSGTQEEINSIMQAILASENSHRVSTVADLPAVLAHLNITPRVAINCDKHEVFSVWRHDASEKVDYVYLFNQGSAVTACPVTFAVPTESVPFVYNAWVGTQLRLFNYERSKSGLTVPISLATNQTTILAFKPEKGTTTSSCPLSVRDGSNPILKEKRPGSINVGLLGHCTIESRSGKSWSFTLTPPPPTSISNWNITIEDWKSSSNLSDVHNNITTTKFTNHSLKPWRLFGPEFKAVSGMGIYTAEFTVPEGNSTANNLGTRLHLGPVDNTLRVYIDGIPVAPVDITNAVVDLGHTLTNSLVPGSTHILNVEVSSTLFNRVKAEKDQIMVFGTRASTQPEYANSSAKDYGLKGPVVLEWKSTTTKLSLMSAPQIPNLNTLRRGGGRGGRLRGRGGGLTGDQHGTGSGAVSAKDRVVQNTDNDASVSRLSAVELGYLEDPFAKALTAPGAGARRFPIINRGTYVRTTAIDILVFRFLRSTDGQPPRKKQIISLGAGSDTRVFRLLARHPHADIVYHELDFPTNTATKIKFIRGNPLLQRTLSIEKAEDLTISEAGDALHSPSYHIHPIDLRSLAAWVQSSPESDSRSPSLQGLDTSLPTLLLSECCLIYLSPAEADGVVNYFTKTLFHASTNSGAATPTQDSPSPASGSSTVPLGIVIYEPIRPDDAFGKTMVSNLATRGIQLQTLHKYASLNAQRQRLQDHGFNKGQEVADIDFIWERWVSDAEKERVSGLEMLDEIEEWRLLAQHYCITWGWREDPDSDGVFDGWKEIEAQYEK
ncbi:RING zinc finger protein [Paecilomyces variotii No. 5]|uniref:Leucine carboxyl methyltransferase 1 n=1 Tax=Byssochlamys spectabilis (strain No. 5 / NBRC 109023) TaxID=1356009 RepID=V5G147_BYSSN|nr:RING zinc finger protein [Paecilomyces variotii No. 5]